MDSQKYRDPGYQWSDFRDKTEPAYASGDPQVIRDHAAIDSADAEVAFALALAKCRLGASPRGKAVDVGCGPGAIAAALMRAGFETVGFDISETAIGLARAAHPDIDFFVGNGVFPGQYFAESSLDLVFIREFHPLKTPEHQLHMAVIAAYLSVLKPGGLLAIFQGAPRTIDFSGDTRKYEGPDFKKIKSEIHLNKLGRACGPHHYHLHKKLGLQPWSLLDVTLDDLACRSASLILNMNIGSFFCVIKP